MIALVVLLVMVCPMHAGQPGDACDDIEIRARSCAEAAAWAQGWIPHGWAIVAADCREERMAAR